MKVVLDSTILIDHLRGIPEAIKELGRHASASISILTWIEVMAGGRSAAEEETLKKFLADFDCIPLDAQVAQLAAAIRRQHKLKLPDAVIYATAQVRQATLITRNTRDFPENMEGVRIPYRM